MVGFLNLFLSTTTGIADNNVGAIQMYTRHMKSVVLQFRSHVVLPRATSVHW